MIDLAVGVQAQHHPLFPTAGPGVGVVLQLDLVSLGHTVARLLVLGDQRAVGCQVVAEPHKELPLVAVEDQLNLIRGSDSDSGRGRGANLNDGGGRRS